MRGKCTDIRIRATKLRRCVFDVGLLRIDDDTDRYERCLLIGMGTQGQIVLLRISTGDKQLRNSTSSITHLFSA